MKDKGLKIPIFIIQSDWDWGFFHFPWNKSNRQIFQENVPLHFLHFDSMPGLHNVTLGKYSKLLAEIIKRFL